MKADIDELERVVVAAVIERNSAYLVCRRPPHKRHGGFWEFPGGKVESDETLLQALTRELNEELNLEVVGDCSEVFSVKDQASGFLIKFLKVSVDGDPKLLEHTECAWLHLSDLTRLNLAPSDAQFRNYLQAD